MSTPKEPSDDRIAKAIRISAELDNRLKNLAHERQVSANLIVTWALEDYLDNAKSLDAIRG